MKLQTKFFNAFFYPFLAGVIFSIIIVFVILFYYSNNYLDKKSAEYIYSLEMKYASKNINSVNILLSNTLLKIQVGMQEQINFYNNIASKMTPESKLQNKISEDVKNIKYLLDNNMRQSERVDYLSFWFQNKEKKEFSDTDEEKLTNLYQQVATFSKMTQSLYSVILTLNDILLNLYFYFEDTEVFIGYPFKYFYDSNVSQEFYYFDHNPSWCTDQEGNLVDYYRFKCRDIFNSMLRLKEGAFDMNERDQPHRKIYITPPYFQFGDKKSDEIFTICIKFYDNISNKDGYLCADILYNNLFDSFDNINERLIGYFSIVSIGINNAFYFPQMFSYGSGKTIEEYIFRWDKDYYLEEKINFVETISKYLTSNYYKDIDKESLINEPMSIFNELIINDSTVENQYFYLNKKKYHFSIFPIVLQNYNKEYEHILSIIYIYNKKLFYQHILNYQNESYSKLIFQLFIFVCFGTILLYLVVLGFDLIAKYIVIPIKNVHYMLEGINIGGENRIKFLNSLQKKQEDNLEKLNKINLKLMQRNNLEKNKNRKKIIENRTMKFVSKTLRKPKGKDKDKDKENNNNDEVKKNTFDNKTLKKKNSNIIKIIHEDEKLLNLSTDIIDDEDSNNNNNDNNNLELNGEIINPNINYEKLYDLDSDNIEKELNFYDFDEELLQYRPSEINQLVQSLLNLKSALILTSSENEVEKIIDYSNSEYIFDNFRNKEGSRLCQSNIGNLQSQLLKYDKAIYHLALSLENVELKKFLSMTLSDELDESDTLLHKIEINYNKNHTEKILNKLVKKQQDNKHKNFSQKIIGILINSRYNKLINIYFKFFSYIQKSNYNYEKLNGWYMHTNFHTINYYHKTLIQYIYLCFISNDLVKIGESILDYIEFLIKFKLKVTKKYKYIFYVVNKDIPEIKKKQEIKKKYFDKIISWFNLFDSYEKQINENSALGNYKDVLDAYTHNLSSNHNDFNSGNQSALLFQINLQRCDYLKGKFALVCKDYFDALKYFINAAKKKRIVVDGLIKKRALEHIKKIADKVKKSIINKNFSNLKFNETFYGINNNENKNKLNNINNNNNISEEKNATNEEEKKDIRFIEAIGNIIDVVKNDIEECNEKQLKDIVILIDFNYSNKMVIDSFIDVTKTILKNYLTNNDRLGIFLLLSEHRIICPMMCKYEIDIGNISKDLDTYSTKIFKKERFDSSLENEIIEEKLEVKDLESYNNSLDNSNNFSNDDDDMYNDNYEILIEDTIKSVNYCINYLKMKEINTNEKFFIYFTTNIKKFMDYLMEINEYKNIQNLSYDSGEKKNLDLKNEKKINFLLVGKCSSEENENEIYKKILLNYFGSKSEMIPYDNMKKIKSILSSNNIINDNIIFPNEIYK